MEEVSVKLPVLRLHRRLAESCLDEAVRRLKILIHEEAGGHERLTDGVHVLARFLLREIRREPQRVNPPIKQRRECVFILTTGKAAHHRAAARAFQLAVSSHGAVTQRPDHRKTLLIIRLVRLLWRHLFQSELVNDVPRLDEVGCRF